jgi:hypothetical protein
MSETETVKKDEKKKPDTATKKEKEAQENKEYTDTLKEIETLYKNTVLLPKQTFDSKCKEFMARLYAILKKPDPAGVKMSIADIKRHIKHDTRQYWSSDWIEKNLPPELIVNPQSNENAGAGGQATTTETKTGEAELDPKEAKIKELSSELKLAKQTTVEYQKLTEKGNKKMQQLTELVENQTKEIAQLKQGSKAAQAIKDNFNEKLNAIEVTVTGVSIQRIDNFSKTAHGLSDKVKLTIKLGSGGNGIIDSIKKV